MMPFSTKLASCVCDAIGAHQPMLRPRDANAEESMQALKHTAGQVVPPLVLKLLVPLPRAHFCPRCCVTHVCIYVGLARTVYMQRMFGDFPAKDTEYTPLYIYVCAPSGHAGIHKISPHVLIMHMCITRVALFFQLLFHTRVCVCVSLRWTRWLSQTSRTPSWCPPRRAAVDW